MRKRMAANGHKSLMDRVLELQAIAQIQIAKADARFAEHQQEMRSMEREYRERFAALERSMAIALDVLKSLPEEFKDFKQKIGFKPA